MTFTFSDWNDYTRKIQFFLDETTEISLFEHSFQTQFTSILPWGRTATELHDEKSCFSIDGGQATKKLSEAISLAKRTALEFGNASLIISTDGSVRVGNPFSSFATKDPYGNTKFYEKLSEDIFVVSVNGFPFVYSDDSEPVSSSDRIFSIFRNHDFIHPMGQSLLTPSTRDLIVKGTLLKFFGFLKTKLQSNDQLWLSGITDETMVKIKKAQTKGENPTPEVLMGAQKLFLAPEGTSLNKISGDAADISVYLQTAKDFCSSTGLNLDDLGIDSQSRPTSAEASWISRQTLGSKVKSFISQIDPPIQSAISYYAQLLGEEQPRVLWEDPLQPPRSSSMDALSKYVASIKQLKELGALSNGVDLAALLSDSGLSSDQIRGIKQVGELPNESTEA